MGLGFSLTGNCPGKQDREPPLLALGDSSRAVPCVLTDHSVSPDRTMNPEHDATPLVIVLILLAWLLLS